MDKSKKRRFSEIVKKYKGYDPLNIYDCMRQTELDAKNGTKLESEPSLLSIFIREGEEGLINYFESKIKK